MEIILPQFGLFFWTVVIFLAIFLLLRKFAWGPILQSLKAREESIEAKLQSAAEAEKKMQQLTNQNEQLLAQARTERDKLLREANAMKDQIVNEARKQASVEADKLIANARQQIELEKNAAVAALRKEAGELALSIAEKVIRKKLENSQEEQAFIKGLIADTRVN